PRELTSDAPSPDESDCGYRDILRGVLRSPRCRRLRFRWRTLWAFGLMHLCRSLLSHEPWCLLRCWFMATLGGGGAALLRSCLFGGACLLRRRLFDRRLLRWPLRSSRSFSCRFSTALRGYWFHGFRTLGCLLRGHGSLLGLHKRATFRGGTGVSRFATTHG